MAGTALLGFLAGSGLWLTAITLYFLYTAFHASIDALAHLAFLYRKAHPKKPLTILRYLTTLLIGSLCWITFAITLGAVI
jgi:hypothetical protein